MLLRMICPMPEEMERMHREEDATHNNPSIGVWIMSEIRQKIRNHLVEEFNLEAPPDDASPLVQQGILDSLGIFMLIEFFKDAFGVRINPDDVSLENFETINAMEKLILSARSPVSPGSKK